MILPRLRFAGRLAALLVGCTPALTLALVLAAPALADEPPSAGDAGIAGRWEGAIETPNGELTVLVDFRAGEGGAWTGKISIPKQDVQDQPLEEVILERNAVSFIIGGVPGRPAFNGRLAPDGVSISGGFEDGGGAALPFHLIRAAPAE